MTDNDYKQIKLFVLDELKKSYSAPTVTLWFEPMRVVSLENGLVMISFPANRRSFVEAQYYDVLKAKFSEILGFDVDLTVITDEDEAEMRLNKSMEGKEKPEEEKPEDKPAVDTTGSYWHIGEDGYGYEDAGRDNAFWNEFKKSFVTVCLLYGESKSLCDFFTLISHEISFL